MSSKMKGDPTRQASIKNYNGRLHLGGVYALKDGRLCELKFFGEVHFTEGPMIGLEIIIGQPGKHNGEYDRVRYFTCPEGKGVFKRPAAVVRRARDPRRKKLSVQDSPKSIAKRDPTLVPKEKRDPSKSLQSKEEKNFKRDPTFKPYKPQLESAPEAKGEAPAEHENEQPKRAMKIRKLGSDIKISRHWKPYSPVAPAAKRKKVEHERPRHRRRRSLGPRDFKIDPNYKPYKMPKRVRGKTPPGTSRVRQLGPRDFKRDPGRKRRKSNPAVPAKERMQRDRKPGPRDFRRDPSYRPYDPSETQSRLSSGPKRRSSKEKLKEDAKPRIKHTAKLKNAGLGRDRIPSQKVDRPKPSKVSRARASARKLSENKAERVSSSKSTRVSRVRKIRKSSKTQVGSPLPGMTPKKKQKKNNGSSMRVSRLSNTGKITHRSKSKKSDTPRKDSEKSRRIQKNERVDNADLKSKQFRPLPIPHGTNIKGHTPLEVLSHASPGSKVPVLTTRELKVVDALSESAVSLEAVASQIEASTEKVAFVGNVIEETKLVAERVDIEIFGGVPRKETLVEDEDEDLDSKQLDVADPNESPPLLIGEPVTFSETSDENQQTEDSSDLDAKNLELLVSENATSEMPSDIMEIASAALKDILEFSDAESSSETGTRESEDEAEEALISRGNSLSQEDGTRNEGASEENVVGDEKIGWGYEMQLEEMSAARESEEEEDDESSFAEQAGRLVKQAAEMMAATTAILEESDSEISDMEEIADDQTGAYIAAGSMEDAAAASDPDLSDISDLEEVVPSLAAAEISDNEDVEEGPEAYENEEEEAPENSCEEDEVVAPAASEEEAHLNEEEYEKLVNEELGSLKTIDISDVKSEEKSEDFSLQEVSNLPPPIVFDSDFDEKSAEPEGLGINNPVEVLFGSASNLDDILGSIDTESETKKESQENGEDLSFKRISIQNVTHRGMVITVDVNSKTTIYEVKRQVWLCHCILVVAQVLSYKKRILSNDQTMKEVGVLRRNNRALKLEVKNIQSVEKWTVNDVCTWCTVHPQLQHFSSTFQQHQVDGTKLLQLDEMQCISLGVHSEDEQNNILNAIQLLKQCFLMNERQLARQKEKASTEILSLKEAVKLARRKKPTLKDWTPKRTVKFMNTKKRLKKYSKIWIDHEVSGERLIALTEDDLLNMGIGSKSDCKTIMDMVQKVRTSQRNLSSPKSPRNGEMFLSANENAI